jgi:hypothetical protein
MTASKSLPARPSLESLRKQAKKLARDVAGGDLAAIARARVHLANVELPLTQRNAQLVIAREYGFAGWQDLTAEVSKRLGHGLAWAIGQARRAIHDNDIEGLKRLLAEHAALLSWQGHEGDNTEGLVGIATSAYGDAGNPESEQWFTRLASAELLIDAGAVVTPSVCESLLVSRARGLLQLFERKGLLPRTLKFSAALGDLGAVRAAVDESDLKTVNEAFVSACHFGHEDVASLLLERLIALQPGLGKHIDGRTDRGSFIKAFEKSSFAQVAAFGVWKVFIMEQVSRALDARDLGAFVRDLQGEPWLLGDAFVDFQAELIGNATVNDSGEFIAALLELEPAILRRRPPPQGQAIEFAFAYGNAHLVPLLTRIWPVPDDLPHVAGMGDLARVKRWFDAAGAPALGDLKQHYPCSPYMPKDRIEEYARQWGPLREQRVLDAALAFSITNRHFEVADFLLAHGADINTTWNTHEPASLLHHLVFYGDYESMQFLIDRGIDMTIKDHRWNATARGWAMHARKDEQMAKWLAEVEGRRAGPR